MISKELIEENKQKLLAEQKKLRGILNKEIQEGAGEFPGEYKPKYDELGSEEGENASEVENFQNDLSVTQELEARLKKVDAALVKIAEGNYGTCKEGDEIDENRLRAEPAAETCLTHARNT